MTHFPLKIMAKTTQQEQEAPDLLEDVHEESATGNGAAPSRKERKEAKARAKQERKEAKARAKQQKAEAKDQPTGKEKPMGEVEEGAVELPPPRDFRRIGHKGADAIVKGNTIESFEAAVEHGAEIVEFDVLPTREGRLIVAHDYHDASMRRPLSLTEVLDAFCQAPLDKVEINCDLKLPGREAELAGSIAGHGLGDRAMISTMEIGSLLKLRSIDPELRLGWTIPKTRRDWTKESWARAVLGAGLYVLRRRLPALIRERAPLLDVESVWAYHWLVSPEAMEAADDADVEVYAWTVDESERIDELAALGVHGIVSNDPRMLT